LGARKRILQEREEGIDIKQGIGIGIGRRIEAAACCVGEGAGIVNLGS